MIFIHVKCFKFHFHFAFGIKSSKVVFKFHDEEIEIQEPDGVVQVQKCRFKTIQCDPLQIGKGIVDLGFFVIEEVLAVPKIQFTLKNEGMEFLWVRTIEWIGFPEFGFGSGGTGLVEFIDSCDESESFCFLLIHCCSQSIIGSLVVHGIGM